MSAELNHIIVPAKDRWESARFLAGILGLDAGLEWAHFVPVRLANGVTLDFADSKDLRTQHYAFLVGEAEFDAALTRLREATVETTPNSTSPGPARSTTSMAAAASISTIRAAI
jgi:hypothetical protein